MNHISFSLFEACLKHQITRASAAFTFIPPLQLTGCFSLSPAHFVEQRHWSVKGSAWFVLLNRVIMWTVTDFCLMSDDTSHVIREGISPAFIFHLRSALRFVCVSRLWRRTSAVLFQICWHQEWFWWGFWEASRKVRLFPASRTSLDSNKHLVSEMFTVRPLSSAALTWR